MSIEKIYCEGEFVAAAMRMRDLSYPEESVYVDVLTGRMHVGHFTVLPGRYMPVCGPGRRPDEEIRNAYREYCRTLHAMRPFSAREIWGVPSA